MQSDNSIISEPRLRYRQDVIAKMIYAIVSRLTSVTSLTVDRLIDNQLSFLLELIIVTVMTLNPEL